MLEISSENLNLFCKFFQSHQEFQVDNTKKYEQLISNSFWVVYYVYFRLGKFKAIYVSDSKQNKALSIFPRQ